MTDHENETNDLIDLDSQFLESSVKFNNNQDAEVLVNLLDADLPVLQETLEANFYNQNTNSSVTTVNFEDILITIDDEELSNCSILKKKNNLRRSKSDININAFTNQLAKSSSCENLHVFKILQNLDETLNAGLVVAEKQTLDCNEEENETIEDCLLELDYYLQTIEQDNFHNCNNSEEIPQSSFASTTALRNGLLQIESNYTKFLASSQTYQSYFNTSNPEIYTTEVFDRNSPSRATIGPIANGSFENVENFESEAHASIEYPVGRMESPSTSKEEVSSWMRNSMRRLRHFRLPNDTPVRDVIDVETTRPVSAPSRLASVQRESRHRVRISNEAEGRARSSSASSRSRRLRSLSSSVTSLSSTVDSSPGCTPAPTPTEQDQEQRGSSPRRPCERTHQNDMPNVESPLGQWPHSLSSMMACLGCTLGLFNISRFAISTIHFGANFIFQFIILSFIFGLPLFTLQLCFGQQLGAGVIDMWRISPLFQGVGVALLIGQTLLGLYSVVGVSWLFVYFRDSFITKMDKYRWAEPFLYYRSDAFSHHMNGTYKLSETVPDYFNGIVLQRHNLNSGNVNGTIKFQLAFNLAVVWMIIFVSLSKGLRSYGKVVYVFTVLPIFGTFVLCAKLLGIIPPEFISVIFPETGWNEFFLNPKSWLAAAQETFLTWGILGTSIMQIASHNKHKHLLQRDSSLVATITLSILLLIAFLANACVQILKSYGYSYLPNSFEQISSSTFLRSLKDPLPPSLANTPVKYMVHNSFFLGEKVVRGGIDTSKESGYQVLRLATELVPATFAVLGSDQLSPFWAVLFYFILILFGIAQQLAIWHCVITGIMAIKIDILKSWETTITLISCICGFAIGLGMATEFGIFVVYFMDYTVGGIWWLIVVILLQIIAVFMVRGRPYSGDTVVTALFSQNNYSCISSWAPALLSFTWNVILPVALMVLCITTFKNGNFRDIFVWHHAPMPEYWPLWARQLGSILQLLPIFLVPIIAVIQSYRYLNNGPSDILEDDEEASNYRIQLLYRPPIGEHMTEIGINEVTLISNNSSSTGGVLSPPEDPPPKYTPPPSYTTATGARIAKFLRQSLRRSVNRITNVLGDNTFSRSRIQNTPQVPPPDYNAVIVEMNQSADEQITNLSGSCYTASTFPRLSTLERLRNIQPTLGSPTITAAEVASILRSSFRRSGIRGRISRSGEHLVTGAAPIGETTLVVEHLECQIEQIDSKRSSNSSVI